jgi:hypothetical protein
MLINIHDNIPVHNWYDVLAGAIIGICTALVAFRQTFASVFDFRFNHLLLPRATSVFHHQPFLPVSGRGPFFTYQSTPEIVSYDLPFTREGGWGYGGGEQTVGAPGDATVLNIGMGGSTNNAGSNTTAMPGTAGQGIERGAVGQNGNMNGKFPDGNTAANIGGNDRNAGANSIGGDGYTHSTNNNTAGNLTAHNLV